MKGDRILCNNPSCPCGIFISDESVGIYDSRKTDKRKLMCPHCGSTNTENGEIAIIKRKELQEEIKNTCKKDLNLKPNQDKLNLLWHFETKAKSVERIWNNYEKKYLTKTFK